MISNYVWDCLITNFLKGTNSLRNIFYILVILPLFLVKEQIPNFGKKITSFLTVHGISEIKVLESKCAKCYISAIHAKCALAHHVYFITLL